jgi:hypothetical protein
MAPPTRSVLAAAAAAVAAAQVTPTRTTTPGLCPPGWLYASGSSRCYKGFAGVGLPWGAGDAFCRGEARAANAALASARNQAEWGTVAVRRCGLPPFTAFWVGLYAPAGSDPTVAASWRWSSGASPAYITENAPVVWSLGGPDPFQGNASCATSAGTGQEADLFNKDCALPQAVCCEVPTAPHVTPYASAPFTRTPTVSPSNTPVASGLPAQWCPRYRLAGAELAPSVGGESLGCAADDYVVDTVSTPYFKCASHAACPQYTSFTVGCSYEYITMFGSWSLGKFDPATYGGSRTWFPFFLADKMKSLKPFQNWGAAEWSLPPGSPTPQWTCLCADGSPVPSGGLARCPSPSKSLSPTRSATSTPSPSPTTTRGASFDARCPGEGWHNPTGSSYCYKLVEGSNDDVGFITHSWAQANSLCASLTHDGRGRLASMASQADEAYVYRLGCGGRVDAPDDEAGGDDGGDDGTDDSDGDSVDDPEPPFWIGLNDVNATEWARQRDNKYRWKWAAGTSTSYFLAANASGAFNWMPRMRFVSDSAVPTSCVTVLQSHTNRQFSWPTSLQPYSCALPGMDACCMAPLARTATRTKTASMSFTPRPTRWYANPGCGHGGPCATKSPTRSVNKFLTRSPRAAASPSRTRTRSRASQSRTRKAKV